MDYEYTFADFTQQINLTQYAAHLGYEVDRKKTTPSSIVMRSGADKVIISRKGTKWVYFSVVDDNDNGTIVDFIKNRSDQSLAEIGRALNAWLGGGAAYPSPTSYVREVEEQVFDQGRVQKIFKGCHRATYHSYLQGRGITQNLLNNARFKGRIFFDKYKNAAFPHYDANNAVCGLELKNVETSVFVKGSEKTFWRSHCHKSDHTLVIGEAVIDVLSYALLHTDDNTVYAATGGGMSAEQSALLKSTLNKLINIQTIILATDNDEGGDRLADKLQAAINESDFTGKVKRHSPEACGADWNNVLNLKK